MVKLQLVLQHVYLSLAYVYLCLLKCSVSPVGYEAWEQIHSPFLSSSQDFMKIFSCLIMTWCLQIRLLRTRGRWCVIRDSDQTFPISGRAARWDRKKKIVLCMQLFCNVGRHSISCKKTAFLESAALWEHGDIGQWGRKKKGHLARISKSLYLQPKLQIWKTILYACDLRALRQHCCKNRHDSVMEIIAWVMNTSRNPCLWTQFTVPSTKAG